MRKFVRTFCIGGGLYNLIEMAWRGRSHWSMFLVGGTCFHAIGRVGGKVRHRGKLAVGISCAAAITAIEYASGCLLNRKLKLNVWDYSDQPANINGQVCLPYSLLWAGLSIVALPLYDRLNEKGKVT